MVCGVCGPAAVFRGCAYGTPNPSTHIHVVKVLLREIDGYEAVYENESDNRSVMPSDALGRTRATMLDTTGLCSLLREERVTLSKS